MAGPMSWMRKYQTGMMIVFGVILMVVFLVPSFMDFSGNVGQNVIDKTEVVSFKGGSLNRNQLDMMRIDHYHTMQMIRELQGAASEKKGVMTTPFVPLIAPIEGAENGGENVDRMILARYLSAERAKQMGIVIGDDQVNEYFALAAGDLDITVEQLENTCEIVTQRRRSFDQIREHVKIELAHQQMEEMLQKGIWMFPNATLGLQMYSRVSKVIECDVYPVSIEEKLSDINETPSDAELRKLYEEGKYELPDPEKILPGFKKPRMVNVEYLYGEFETYLQNEINKLTDEEVQAEYDRLVAEQDPMVMEIADMDLPGEAGGELELPGGDTDDAGNEDGKGKEAGAEGDAGGGSEDAAGSEAAAGDGQAGESGSSETTEESKENGGAADAGGNGSVLDAFRSMTVSIPGVEYVAIQNQDAGQEQGGQGSEKDGGNGEKQDAEKQDADGQKTDEQSAGGGEGAGAGEALQQEENAANKEAAQEAGADAADLTMSTEVEKKPRPLKDVADAIKRSMKSRAAEEAMAESMRNAEEKIRGYEFDYQEWRTRKQGGFKEEEPARLDMKQLAADNNLGFGATGLVTIEELAKGELANVVVMERFGQFPVFQVIDAMFSELQLFSPRTDARGIGRVYMYWLSEKESVEIVDFDTAKPRVVEFWKWTQARLKALAEAENIADAINNGGSGLTATFGERASSTGEFTWYRSTLSSFDYGAPIGVDQPGDEFMEVAFGLASGKAGVAPNLSRQKFYVIQKKSERENEDQEVLEKYLNQIATDQRFPLSVMQPAREDYSRTERDVRDSLLEEMQVKWKNQ